MSDYRTSEPQWESTQHGWHAVASLCSGGTQWTAYIEYIDAPYWRIWAGCMFRSLQSAQDWCRKEIEHQLQRAEPPPAPRQSLWHAEPESWRWLWDTLSSELGETRAAEIRTELAERLRKEGTASTPASSESGED